MKKIILIALLLTGLSTQAQYYQGLYFTNAGGYRTEGLSTKIIAPNHNIMVASNGSELSVCYTDALGNPVFNQTYQFPAPMGYSVEAVFYPQVVELLNSTNFSTGGFGIVGTIYFRQTFGSAYLTKAFYMPIDVLGNIISPGIQYYDITGTLSTSHYILGITSAYNNTGVNNDLYITGAVENNNFQEIRSLVMKIDITTGAVLWDNVIRIPGGPWEASSALDVIESPYSSGTINELLVVGGVTPNQQNSATSFGYTMHMDKASGFIYFVDLYGATSRMTQFTSVDVSSNPTSGDPGFIIGGFSNVSSAGDEDMLALKLTQNNTIGFSTAFESGLSFPKATTGRGWDIVERLNTFGRYEYYLCGEIGGANNSSGVVQDGIGVVKIDENGSGVNEFYYNPSSSMASSGYGYASSITAITSPQLGISLFGDFNTGSFSTAFNIKAYFSGHVDCGESIDVPITNAGPTVFSSGYSNARNFNLISQSASSAALSAYESYYKPCFTMNISGANNDRKAADKPKGSSDAIVSPNPMQQGAEAVVVEVVAETPSNVNVAIYDILGRNYYTGSFTLAKGNNQLPLTIADANMAAGMYTIKLTGTDINKTIMLLVK